MTTITLPRAVVQQALNALDAHSWEQVDAARSALRAALAQEPHRDLRAALRVPGCERLREWVEIGPVQRAALETFVAALAQEQAEQTWVCPDSPEHRYKKPGHCEDCGKTLVLAQPNPPGCDHCNHPLYAATKCRVCGRVTEQAEPVQEPGTPATVANLARDIHAAVLRRRESGHEPVRRTMTPKELIAGINGSEKWQVIERALKTDGEKE